MQRFCVSLRNYFVSRYLYRSMADPEIVKWANVSTLTSIKFIFEGVAKTRSREIFLSLRAAAQIRAELLLPHRRI